MRPTEVVMRDQWQKVRALPSSDLAGDGIVWFDFGGLDFSGDAPLELAECVIAFDGDPGTTQCSVTDGTFDLSPSKAIDSNGTAILAFTVGGTIPVPPLVKKLGIRCTPANAVTFQDGYISARLRGSV